MRAWQNINQPINQSIIIGEKSIPINTGDLAAMHEINILATMDYVLNYVLNNYGSCINKICILLKIKCEVQLAENVRIYKTSSIKHNWIYHRNVYNLVK